jgi:hypothetical protein
MTFNGTGRRTRIIFTSISCAMVWTTMVPLAPAVRAYDTMPRRSELVAFEVEDLQRVPVAYNRALPETLARGG